jgi:prophage antirepressor-like protein
VEKIPKLKGKIMELQVFNNSQFKVRTLLKDEEIWFVAKDVCEALGFKNRYTSIALLDDDEKVLHNMDTPGGSQNITIINESGLYSLILRSRKPEAKAFKKWITSEVLPSVRKHGAYMSPETLEKAMLSPDFIIELAGRLKEEQGKTKKLQPKADVYDHAFANTLHSLQRVARTLEGVNTQKTKRDLLNLKYFYKRGGVYRVYHQFRGKLFEEKVDKHRGTVDIFVLDKGKQELVKLYKNRKLTMKKGY